MRTTGVFLIGMILLATALASGCLSVSPGDITYTGSGIRFLVHSDEAVPHAFIEAAVFRDDGLSREEIYRFSDHVPLHTGDTVVSFPLSLKPGKYQCFIYTSSGTQRFPAVIRDFEVT
jgi:hypothetical protein